MPLVPLLGSNISGMYIYEELDIFYVMLVQLSWLRNKQEAFKLK
jgi:hypothetical protein